jgi:hypothetical protein
VKAWGLPVLVIGVVEAGAQGLAETAAGAQGGIAVLATAGTCASKAYPKALAKVTARPVRQLGSARLAAAIEGDPSVTTPIRDIIRAEVGEFLKEAAGAAPDRPFDTVVLGCTHYPLVAEQIREAFAHWRDHRAADGSRPYELLLAPRLLQVDPAAWTAEELWRALRSSDRFSRSARQGDAFFVSVPAVGQERLGADGGLARDYKYGRSAGDVARTDTVVVPLRPEMLPGAAATLVRQRLPLTWRSLQGGR